MAPGGGHPSTVGIGPAPAANVSDDGMPLGGQAMPFDDGRLAPQPNPDCDRLLSHVLTDSGRAAWNFRQMVEGSNDSEILRLQSRLHASMAAGPQAAAVTMPLEVVVPQAVAAAGPQAVAVAKEPAPRYNSWW